MATYRKEPLGSAGVNEHLAILDGWSVIMTLEQGKDIGDQEESYDKLLGVFPTERLADIFLDSMREEYKLTIPTYNADYVGDGTEVEEYGEPRAPILVKQEDGLRIILGGHDQREYKWPDILVERVPKAWRIFLHPLGGSDPAGYLYFFDEGPEVEEGESLLQLEHPMPTPIMTIVQANDKIPERFRNLLVKPKA